MMPRVYVKRDQTLAAVPGSEDFEAALAGGVERLRIFNQRGNARISGTRFSLSYRCESASTSLRATDAIRPRSECEKSRAASVPRTAAPRERPRHHVYREFPRASGPRHIRNAPRRQAAVGRGYGARASHPRWKALARSLRRIEALGTPCPGHPAGAGRRASRGFTAGRSR